MNSTPPPGPQQNRRQVPGAGEAAAPRCRVIQGMQAGSAGLLTVPGGYAAELAKDRPRRAPQVSQGGRGGAQLAHDRRSVDAMAGHVADDQRDLAIIERDHIEPVTAHLRGPAGRPIAVGDL